MREILFRARCENGEWLYGYPVIAPNDADAFCYFYTYGEHGEFYQHIGNIKTLGQYTGLTDKNGTKIFEGDILKVKSRWRATLEDCDGFIGSAASRKTETYWTVDHKIYGTEMGFFTFGIDRRWHRPLTQSRLYNAEAEVVGNIFDNSELLKREKPKNEKDGDEE